MTPARFRHCLTALDWSTCALSRRLTTYDQPVSERTVRRWASGVYPVPDRVGDWMERVVAAVELEPGPGATGGNDGR